MSFKEITIREIGIATFFTRIPIYNYFQTKEEIVLALLQREYELWNGRLNAGYFQALKSGWTSMLTAGHAYLTIRGNGSAQMSITMKVL